MFNIGFSSINSKLEELDRIEEEWTRERLQLISKISTLKKAQEEWPEVKANLIARLHALQAQAEEAGKLALIENEKQNEQNTKTTIPAQNASTSFTSTDAQPVIKPAPAPKTVKKTGKKKKATIHKAPIAPVVHETATTDVEASVAFDYGLKWTLTFHLDAIRCLAFHSTLPYLASGSDDGTIRITNLETKRIKGRRNPIQILSLRGHNAPILSLSSKQNILISGDLNGEINVWDFSEMKSQIYETHGRVNHHQLYHGSEHTDAVWSIASHEKSPFFITASSDQTIRIYDCVTYKSTPIKMPSIPTSVIFLSDGSAYAVGCVDGTILLYNSQNELQTTFNCGSRIISMCPFNQPLQLLVSCEDKNIKVIDLSTKEEKRSFIGHENYVTSLSLINGYFFATISSDKTVRAWRSQTFEIVYAEAHHRNKYGESGLCVASTPATSSHHFFASSGAEGTVKIFALK